MRILLEQRTIVIVDVPKLQGANLQQVAFIHPRREAIDRAQLLIPVLSKVDIELES